ncbi:hypothetical protein RHMOL_Rhmol01G0136600 [Rhododendron molle]|uniref:Uncharacterized protein n=1 Tax=Rhododendron molle TaxID=49168 RepID=A0ACC0Q0V0_RHOML|nr:hypothetical protein RHMOL_Rhmol01G0136600 [Rhododendron molle]
MRGLDIDGNYARNDCDSRRKLEFKDDDDFFNMNAPMEKEASMYTHDVFVLFQRKLSKAHDCNLNQLGHYKNSEELHIEKVDTECKIRKYSYLSANKLDRRSEGNDGKTIEVLCHLRTQLATRATKAKEAYNIALNCLIKIAEEVDASLTRETFHGTSYANNSSSMDNEATLGELIEKRAKGLKVKERASERSSKRPRNALERAIKLKRTPINNLNSMDNSIQQVNYIPFNKVN